MPSIEEIRQQIEATHQEAVHALGVLERYLGGAKPIPSPAISKIVETNPPTQPARLVPARPQTNGVPLRERVRLSIEAKWLTAQEIVVATGLTIRQVRGVLNAPGFSDQIERRSVNGSVHYHFEPADRREAFAPVNDEHQ